MILKDIGTIVATGSLNPPAIQPWWLARTELISEDEALAAKVEAITPEFSVFEVGTWLRLEVLRNRFAASALTVEADKLRLRDLVCGIFSALPHTPLTAIGLNRTVQFEVPGDGYHRMGHTLAPKEFWRQFVKEPGLRSLSIKAQRADDLSGEINVKVGPVLTMSQVVELDYNSHITLPEHSVGQDAVTLIQRALEPALKEGLDIVNSLVHDFAEVRQ